MAYNVFGKVLLPSEVYVPIKAEFVDSNGDPKYREYISQYGDSFGFDKRHYDTLVRDMFLPKGMRICRYGNHFGRFSTDVGTPFEQLSLPYRIDSFEYHEYTVSGTCVVDCVVDKGLVAPGFESPGGGIQYYHHKSLHDSLRDGSLKEEMSWLKKI